MSFTYESMRNSIHQTVVRSDLRSNEHDRHLHLVSLDMSQSCTYPEVRDYVVLRQLAFSL
jgi:hypothetical protein